MEPNSKPLAVVVFAEIDPQGNLRRSSLCAVSFAQELSRLTRGRWALCATVPLSQGLTANVLRLGAARVIALKAPGPSPVLAEELSEGLHSVLSETGATYLVAAATSLGKDLMPRVAGLCDGDYIGDCSSLEIDDTGIAFHKPIYAGNAIATCRPRGERVVLTVRQSEFEPARFDNLEQGTVEERILASTGTARTRVRWIGFDEVPQERPSLLDARIIVTGGRALGRRFFEVLGPLADITGAALGATRAACDTANVPSDLQIGQTGKVVAPELYIAIGVSGSVQHLAGMRGSRVIVAINLDREAPIFSVADYGLVGDLFQLVPELVASLRRRQTSPDP